MRTHFLIATCLALAACGGSQQNAQTNEVQTREVPVTKSQPYEREVTVTKDQLYAAFTEQGGALDRCCFRPTDATRADCLGVAGRRRELADRHADWMAPPRESPLFASAKEALDRSTALLLHAGNDDQRRAALQEARLALQQVKAALDAR